MSALFRRRASTGAFRPVFRFTFRHWGRQKARTVGICLAVVACTLTDVFLPLFSGRIVDAVAQGAANPFALREALSALGAILLLGLVNVALRHGLSTLNNQRTLRMMSEVLREAFHRVQRFSTDWHASAFAGSTVRKMTRGMHALDLLNDTLLLALIPSAVLLVGTSAVLSMHWPLMGLLVLLGSVLYVAVTWVLALLYMAPAARLANQWDTRMGGALADAMGCNAVVRAFAAEDREEGRLRRVVDKWSARVDRTWSRSAVNGSTQNLMMLLFRGGIIGAAIWVWWRGEATAGGVTYVLATFFVIQGYLRDVGMHIRNLQRSVNDLEELVAFDAQPIGVEDRRDARPLRITGGEVVFDRVRFHYAGHDSPLFNDLSVRIHAGESVGLVGRSGSGKTTFVKLLQRLYDVTGGRIRIDGQDIAAATQRSLRSQIAIVHQEPILFHRSLFENIAYARPSAAREDIERAARLANAHDFIVRLPNGYRTLVGERGVKLSGGERQRVALARAFLADAPILILDEATSSLDSESELLIQEAVGRLMRGRTSIVIAHRLSTIRSMDRILVFDRGRVVEEGTHVELLGSRQGLYRSLFEKQSDEAA